MHILESYALACGAKINDCFIYEEFCPLPQERYISIQTSSTIDSLNYSYWQDVINEIEPHLTKAGIKIIQIGDLIGRGINEAIDYRGKASPNHLAYIIRHSVLHLGPDDYAVHLAGHYNRPLVALYGPTYPENTGPYFGDKNNQILLKAYELTGHKPSMSAQEAERSLDAIKPEDIADAVLKLLRLSSGGVYKTVHIGARYGRESIADFLPNQIANGRASDIFDIRMDVLFNEAVLAEQLKRNKCRIFTDKPISLDIIKSLKPNIDSIYYFIGKNDSPEFVKAIADLGIKLALMSHLTPSEIHDKKIKYYEFGSINQIPLPSGNIIEALRGTEGLLYKSCQTVYSNGKRYASFAAEKLKIESGGEFQPVIDTPDFWRDAENFRFATKA
jgi:hypothetical protein